MAFVEKGGLYRVVRRGSDTAGIDYVGLKGGSRSNGF